MEKIAPTIPKGPYADEIASGDHIQPPGTLSDLLNNVLRDTQSKGNS
jgi:hypothetical protein